MLIVIRFQTFPSEKTFYGDRVGATIDIANSNSRDLFHSTVTWKINRLLRRSTNHEMQFISSSMLSSSSAEFHLRKVRRCFLPCWWKFHRIPIEFKDQISFVFSSHFSLVFFLAHRSQNNWNCKTEELLSEKKSRAIKCDEEEVDGVKKTFQLRSMAQEEGKMRKIENCRKQAKKNGNNKKNNST